MANWYSVNAPPGGIGVIWPKGTRSYAELGHWPSVGALAHGTDCSLDCCDDPLPPSLD